MNRLGFAAAAAVVAILVTPAFAQTAAPAGSDSSMTCSEMMTKSHSMSMPADDAAKSKAEAEIQRAQDAMMNNSESSCKKHMMNAMKAMG